MDLVLIFWEGLERADCRRTRRERCIVLLMYPSCAERALPTTLSSKHPRLRAQEPENRQGVAKNAQKWDFMNSRGRASRQPTALKDTALTAPW